MTILVLALSGEPNLDFPQRHADTLSPVADLAADFNLLGLWNCRHSAASPHPFFFQEAQMSEFGLRTSCVQR